MTALNIQENNMTERSKFEQMVERLINEDKAGAEELFHEIVVEKSRAIYQNIIESEEDEDLDEEKDEMDDDDRRAFDKADREPKKKVSLKKAPFDIPEAEDDDEDEDEVSESSHTDDDDEDLDEMFGLNNMAEEDPSMMGGDATDDMMSDIGTDDSEMDDMDDMDDNSSSDEDPMGALDDIEDALDKLRAEFQTMIDNDGDDESESYSDDEEEDDSEADDDDDEDENDNPFDNKEEESFAYEAKNSQSPRGPQSAGEQMREYVEKVQGGDLGSKIGGDNGANTKSTVATKNDMGGTSSNILKGGSESSTEANKGHLKGQSVFKGNPTTDNAGNINVPGGKAGKSSFKKSEPGHGAEKKGKPETADKGAGSTIKSTVRTK